MIRSLATKTDVETAHQAVGRSVNLASPSNHFSTSLTLYIHAPSEWANDTNFKDLVGIRYSARDVPTSFKSIEMLLKAMGYEDDNDKMLHDYILYMIKDKLIQRCIPFLDENDIKKNRGEQLIKCLGGDMPDLYVKGKIIIDV